MQKHLASSKDVKELRRIVLEKYGVDIGERKVEVGKEKKTFYYFLDGSLSFFGEDMTPSLCAVKQLGLKLGEVVVDEGAAKALARGASLYIPGIKEFKCDCKEGDIVIVTYKDVPVALLKVLISIDQLPADRKGLFGENIHHVGDDIWKMCSGSA